MPENLIKLIKFDIQSMVWKDHGEMKLIIEKEPFDKGNFRKAFKAIEYSSDKIWVVKRYKEKAIKNLENLNLGHEEHARKQVQMHTVARNLAERMKKHAPKEFGETFQYDKVFFSLYKEEPVTVEEYVVGEFTSITMGHVVPLLCSLILMGHGNSESQLRASNDKFFTHSALFKRNGNEILFDTDGPHVSLIAQSELLKLAGMCVCPCTCSERK